MSGTRVGVSGDYERTLVALGALMAEIAGDEVPPSLDLYGPDTIRSLNLTSVRLLEFMIEVEDQIGIEWDDDVPATVLASFEAMAHYVVGQKESRTDSPAGGLR